jgi:hypothetical protein
MIGLLFLVAGSLQLPLTISRTIQTAQRGVLGYRSAQQARRACLGAENTWVKEES